MSHSCVDRNAQFLAPVIVIQQMGAYIWGGGGGGAYYWMYFFVSRQIGQ